MSSANNMKFRASNALKMIEQHHFGGSDSNTVARASMNLGMEAGSTSEVAELRIENERLKTTVMILN
jgi:hypothetical protein